MINTLKNNPVFQLSLSSKELFHSNFLLWMADSQTVLFNAILQNIFNTTLVYDPQKHIAKREYHNFDFCICERLPNGDPGRILLVLENKFKSIPYLSQLDKYENKIIEINQKCIKNTLRSAPQKKVTLDSSQAKPAKNFDKILLTLVGQFLGQTNVKTWKIINYFSYADFLLNNLNLVTSTFSKDLIEHYANFIKAFDCLINTNLQKISLNSSWGVVKNQCFQDLRCSDVWQKLVMHKYAQELEKLYLRNRVIDYDSADNHIFIEQNISKVYLGVHYFHGEALIELKVLIEKDCILCIQQQGDNPLSVGVVINAIIPNQGNRISNLKGWLSNKKINSFQNTDIGQYAYGAKKVGGYYYYKYSSATNAVPTITVASTLSQMIDVFNKVLNKQIL